MKTLLLLRHAKSSWEDAGQFDHDRPLNSRGKRDAPRIGKLLADEALVPDVILASSACRAQMTAATVAEHCGFAEEVGRCPEFYLASPEAYIATVATLPEDVHRVLVVGHNPGMNLLLQALTGNSETFPTAALAQVEIPIDCWTALAGNGSGRLINFWRPRELDES